jgi:pSer/pThr/pTyr-binding forkhead associated (FHA) protein
MPDHIPLRILINGRTRFSTTYPRDRSAQMAAALVSQWSALRALGRFAIVADDPSGVSYIIGSDRP